MGFFAREDQPVIWRGPMLHKALEQFLTDVHWDDHDYLLLDLPQEPAIFLFLFRNFYRNQSCL